MDIGLFLLGALGAILTVYLARQEVIPEFRPLFDTSEREKEATEHREHIKKTEGEIDDIQSRLKEELLEADLADRLTTVLKTTLSELSAERNRQKALESEIKQGQIISRSIGFVLYIILGGVFGALLAGKVQVEGLNGDFPDYFESIVIGATWISYLSTIGVRSDQKKVDERIEAGRQDSAEKLNSVKKEITETLLREVAKAERTDKVVQPVNAEAVARMVAEKLDIAAMEVEKDWKMTRNMVQKNLR
jgi:hypothetical protein